MIGRVVDQPLDDDVHFAVDERGVSLERLPAQQATFPDYPNYQ
jgi:hypothetical protein